jgi:hypothetical protein
MRKQKLGSGVGYGHRSLKVEQLERRAMLAGNVSVSVDGAGNLFVTGDNHDNAVLIQEVEDFDDNPNTHAYLITGFDFADSGIGGFESGPTNITGGGEEVDPGLGTSARVVTGVKANIIVDLKKGNDVLGVGNSVEDLILLAEDCGFGLGIGSGSGGGSGSSSPRIVAEDVVLTEKFTAPINLIINLGDGNNAVAVIGDIGVNFNAGSLVINGGKNSDDVAVGSSFQFENDSIIHGDLAIVTQKGDDNICVHNATIFGAMAINAGDGFNEVSGENFEAAAAAIVTGKNNDEISLTSFDLDTALTINSGNANKVDSVLVEDFTAGGGFGPNNLPVGGGAVTVVTGNGNDLVVLENFNANAVTIVTGSGNDGGGIEASSVASSLISGPISVIDAALWVDLNGNNQIDENEPLGPLTIVTGAGHDSVEVEEVTALTLTAALGAGNDRMFVEDVFIGVNMTVDAGAGNDFVQIQDCTIIAVLTVAMGAGNDELEIFNVSFGTLVADGGSGRDAFFNDLDVDSNGNFDFDANGVPHIIVRNFEIFEI